MPGASLLLAVLLLQAPAAPPGEARLAAQSRRGKELMAAGRYGEAAAVYRELVKALPRNPGLLVNLGMALHFAGQHQEAIPHLESALRLDPESLPATLYLGAARLAVGDAAGAIAPLQKAAKRRPDDVETLSLLAQALLDARRPAEAAPHLRRLTQLVPRDPAAWFNLGQTYEDLAGQGFEDLLAREPESPFVLALVAEVRLSERRTTAAFQLYRQAAARAPAMRGVHAALAEIYRGAGHADWASVEEAKERRLGKADCARAPLECAFAEGRYRDVVSGAGAARTAEASYWRIRAYGELATQAFETLATLPPSVHSHEWSAQVHRNARRYAEAAGEWRKAVALAPDDPRLRTELAITLKLDRDLAGARRELEQARRMDPGSPQVSFLLGDLLLAQEQPDQAIPLLEKSVQAEPEQPLAHGALGRAYALVGRPADAIPHLEQALPADVDGSLRYQLARSYQATGQRERAAAALADYEEFRKATRAEEEGGDAPALTPPEGLGPPSR